MITDALYQRAMAIAESAEVSTPRDSVVVYSVSFLPTRQNKEQAFEYIKNNPQAKMIDHTPCGKQLVELGFDDIDLSDEDKHKAAEIWKVASQRFIRSASGNVMAFVKNADPRSVFRTLELPEIIANPQIITINGINKNQFKSLNCW